MKAESWLAATVREAARPVFERLMSMSHAERIAIIASMRHRARCEEAHRTFDVIYVGA